MLSFLTANLLYVNKDVFLYEEKYDLKKTDLKPMAILFVQEVVDPFYIVCYYIK